MDNPIENRIYFYRGLKQVVNQVHLVESVSPSIGMSGGVPDILLDTFEDNCLLVTYSEELCHGLPTVCFNVWGKFTQKDSLFIMGVKPHYANTFCGSILPKLKRNCSAVDLIIYSEVQNRPLELYCNF